METVSMKSLSEIEVEIARFDQLLTPIAKRPVDISDPGWVEKLKNRTPALDEAGIRAPVEALLLETLEQYANGDEGTRVTLRDLFHRYHAFSWAASLPQDPNPEGFRRQLLLLSLKDQGMDPRDEILWLQSICKRARLAGVDLKPTLELVAGLSSDVDRFGMGSTKNLLLKARGWVPTAGSGGFG
jgi:hypothetical protein